MNAASFLTILILLAATPALMTGTERLALRARRAGQIRDGQQLGPVVHPQSFAARYRANLLRCLVVAVPVVATIAFIRSGAPE